MSFIAALSGLNAAQTDISVTSNNIANVGTFGFYGSRAEFADVYAHSASTAPTMQIGSGTQPSRIYTDFSQGAITSTGNMLDLSLQGPGFFQVLTDDATVGTAYTRSGAFQMDAEGFVVNADGAQLASFPTAENGDALSMTTTQPLHVPPTRGQATPTSTITMSLNVGLGDNGGAGTQASVPAAPFDPADSSTYAFSTLVPVRDAEGQPIEAEAFFVMSTAPTATDASLAYEVQLMVDGQIASPADPAASVLSFDGDGVMTSGGALMGFTAGETDLSMDLSDSSLDAGNFSVASVEDDGSSILELTSLDVGTDGVVRATYGGETAVAVGSIAIGTFTNMQGLKNIGNASYGPTSESGEVRLGTPGSAGFGEIRSGSIEGSNVELTEQLVNLIMAQRNYQASAKALETNSQLAQTVMNMRS